MTILLKDKSHDRQTEDELEWYERAFGAKRNIMSVFAKFAPPENPSYNKCDWFAQIKFTMFEELAEEFRGRKHTETFLMPLERDISELDLPEWYSEMEMPYGHVDVKLMFRMNAETEEGEEQKMQDAPETTNDFFNPRLEPKPISRTEQDELDEREEKEMKERETEARLAQKKLEEEKAKLRIEQQQQILKQEQNSAKLKVYFRAMNLSFHKVRISFHNCAAA